MTEENLTLSGFQSGWLQRFFWQPFDPLCIMLAMRSKLMLDAIDELGHSYNLLRWLVHGFDVPIPILPPLEPPGGDPSIPPYVPSSGPPYVPPTYPGGGGGGGWNPTPQPPGWGGYPPGSQGGYYGHGAGGNFPFWCTPKPPALAITIGYSTLTMNCGESQELTVEGAWDEAFWDYFEFYLTPDQGSFVHNGHGITLTAPEGGEDCVPSWNIALQCGNFPLAEITITINTVPISAEIGYTSLQMQVNEQQELTAVYAGQPCSGDAMQWQITAGGGTLSAETGDVVIYTAPATNAECANNPTITLSYGDVVQDTLSMAINAVTGTTAAWKRTKGCKEGCQVANGQSICGATCTSTPGYYCCQCASLRYKCSNAYLNMTDNMGSAATTPANCSAAWPVWCGADPATVDLRTALMKTQGCCPAGLL